MKLKELAQLQIGYQHRVKVGDRDGQGGRVVSKVQHEPTGSHRIIQIKDINSNDRLDTSDLLQLNPEASNPSKYEVTEGDVLFLSRGRRLIGIPVTEPMRNTLAAYYFYIIKLKAGGNLDIESEHSQVLPEYLAWVIGQPEIQRCMVTRTIGSNVQLIPKAEVEDLDIPVPPLAIQGQIVGLENLRIREKALTANLISKRDLLIRGISQQVIQGTIRGDSND